MMILSIMDLIILALGAVLVLLVLRLSMKGLADQAMFDGLNDEDYPFHEMYGMGYQVTKLLKLDYKNKRDRKLRKELCSLYEPKYADYYIRAVYSQRFTMTLIVAACACPLYCLSQSVLLFVLALAGAVGAYIYYGMATKELIEKKKEEFLSDFSNVVSKLALLVNAGMILTEAWERVAFSSDRPIYQEMQRSVAEIRNGTSASDAINQFGVRCMLPEIRKFTSTLIQGIAQGNAELSPMLRQQSSEVWELKKQLVRRQGELADSKLLLPMCLTFVGILIMIVVPIFANLGA